MLFRSPEKIFLINPFGRLYREVTASNLVAIDIDGNPVRETEYPVNRAGFVIHSAIHANVEQAHCVMHTHTVSGMAVSCLAEGLMHDSFNGAQLKGRVAYHDFEGVTVRPDEQTRLLASIGQYLCSPRPDGLAVHLYAGAELRAALPAGEFQIGRAHV